MSAAAAAEKMLDAFAAGDLPGALSALDEDLVLIQSRAVPWGGEYHGRGGFLEFVGKMGTLVEAVIVESEILDLGDRAVSRILTRFTDRASGESVEFPVVELYWAENGLLTRIEPYYLDQVALNAAISAPDVA